MSIFNLDQWELMTFFMVLVRFSILVAVLPFFGDLRIPATVKILLAVSAAFVIYPVLRSSGLVDPGDSMIWSADTLALVGTLTLEALFSLALAFTARIVFDTIRFGSEVTGNLMGFGAASFFDPTQESQSQVLTQFQTGLSMLTFLAIDGHHSLLHATVNSYRIVGIGKANLGAALSERLISLTADMVKTGFQIAGPMALSMFAVHVVYGVLAKSIPQVNILILSFSVSAIAGLFVLLISFPQFQDITQSILGRVGEEMGWAMRAMSQ